MDVRRAAVADVLVDHQAYRGGCLCGWRELGQRHSQHVADQVLAAADLASALESLRRRSLATAARVRRASARRSWSASS